jgi:hypothetical protein
MGHKQGNWALMNMERFFFKQPDANGPSRQNFFLPAMTRILQRKALIITTYE